MKGSGKMPHNTVILLQVFLECRPQGIQITKFFRFWFRKGRRQKIGGFRGEVVFDPIPPFRGLCHRTRELSEKTEIGDQVGPNVFEKHFDGFRCNLSRQLRGKK